MSDIGVHNIAVSEITPAWVELSLLQRVLAYDWSKEGYILLSIALFAGIHLYFVNANRNRVARWVAHHTPVLRKEFHQVGVSPLPGAPLVAPYSPVIYSTYATGRVGIDAVSIDMELVGRHNPITLSLEYLLSIFFSHQLTTDSVKITIVPNPKTCPIHPAVFGIVNKENMKDTRDKNYFFSITKTSDAPKRLPETFVFMSESAELTDSLFSDSLAAAVRNAGSFLRYFVLTDLKRDTPKTLEDLVSRPRVVIRTALPKTDAEYATSAELLQAAIDFVDAAPRASVVRPDVSKKIKATRDSEVRKIVKAQDEAKAEELAKKKAEEKRNLRNQVSKLSPAEQKKFEQKERDREARKQRSKNARRI